MLSIQKAFSNVCASTYEHSKEIFATVSVGTGIASAATYKESSILSTILASISAMFGALAMTSGDKGIVKRAVTVMGVGSIPVAASTTSLVYSAFQALKRW